MEQASGSDLTLDALGRLESRVDELVRLCANLREENRSLRTRQETLVVERAELIEKTALARNRVEAMISRLKAMEEAP
jgi:cell division protein ZapB